MDTNFKANKEHMQEMIDRELREKNKLNNVNTDQSGNRPRRAAATINYPEDEKIVLNKHKKVDKGEKEKWQEL
jgi:hypothetical protein